ncbi:hypothetical protein [Alitabrizicola rongguiensis]|uniref:hypothetical protein n=1 Tax=Alitabrizicola rongguiensis TaxID=2909234 RepID=UPI001F2C90F4|nr:hypothetical protein [Tabrizicola rongguiensis]
MTGSLILTLIAASQIAMSDQLAPLRERSAEEIVAVTDVMMARAATPERLTELIETRLAEDPRNWATLTALRDAATEQGVVLPPVLITAYELAKAEDGSLANMAGDCASCAWDISSCSLSNAMICKLPILVTPVEDVRGVVKAGRDYLAGDDVDEVDLGLSVVGLGATALVLFTGGTSETLKLGAAAAKLARGMKILSPGIERMALTAVRTGVDWKALTRIDGSVESLAGAVRLDAFQPLADVASDIGRIGAATGPTSALHLVRYVDDAPQARQMARAAEALGPRAVARAEVLGPARLMRSTMRLTGTAWELISGLLGLIGSITLLLIGALKGAAFRHLRRLSR